MDQQRRAEEQPPPPQTLLLGAGSPSMATIWKKRPRVGGGPGGLGQGGGAWMQKRAGQGHEEAALTGSLLQGGPRQAVRGSA